MFTQKSPQQQCRAAKGENKNNTWATKSVFAAITDE